MANGESINIGDTVEVTLAEWLAKSDGLYDKYMTPVTTVVGVIKAVSSKMAIMLEITEPFKGKVLWLAPSLVDKGAIKIAVFKGGNTDVDPVETNGVVVKPVDPYPHGRIYLSGDGKFICAKTPFELKERCRMVVGGRWNANDRVWQWAANGLSALALHEAFTGSGADMNDARFQALVTAGKGHEAAASLKEADLNDLSQPEGLKTSLWLHQLRGFHYALALGCAGLFMAMGTGKTLTVLAYIMEAHIMSTLVMAPKSVVASWARDAKKHVAADIIVCALDKGSVESKVKRAREAVEEGRAKNIPVIVVINYESAWRHPFGLEIDEDNHIKETGFAFKADFDLMVLDESHKIKSHTGRAAKFCQRLAKRVSRRLLLTGTPMPHDPLDVFSQFLVLDLGATFGTNFSKFKTRYAELGGYEGREILGWRNMRELNQKVYRSAFRVTEDVVQLPPRNFIERYGELSAKERKAYDSMAKELMVAFERAGELKDELAAIASELVDANDPTIVDQWEPLDADELMERYKNAKDEQDTITAQNVLVKMLKLAQLASGFITDEEGKAIEYGESKLNLLMETLEDIDRKEPFVVFVRFKRDIDAIRARLIKEGYAVAELSGRRNQLADWQDGKYQALVVQLQAGGVGVDFTKSGDIACRYCIYYGKDFNWGNYAQSLKRIHRPGQTETVTFISLIMENTIDETVEGVLEQRGSLVEAVLAARGLTNALMFAKPEKSEGDDQDAYLLDEALAG